MATRNGKSGTRLTQKKFTQERKIKVNSFYYMYRLKDDPGGAGRPVPWLQVKGHWLREAGFEVDTPVRIRVMNGCLVLTVE